MDNAISRIEAFALQTLDALPAPFRELASDVGVQVAETPQTQMLIHLGIADPLALTGLYDGTPMTEKSVSAPDPYPDVIWLFSAPILAELEARPDETLERLVAHIMIHELAHHFGWSDTDIARIDQWWL